MAVVWASFWEDWRLWAGTVERTQGKRERPKAKAQSARRPASAAISPAGATQRKLFSLKARGAASGCLDSKDRMYSASFSLVGP